MRQLTTLLLMFFLVYASGCATSPKSDLTLGPEPDVKAQTAPLLSTHTIDKKISFLEEIVAKEALSEEDRRVATDLLATYKLTKKLAPDRLTKNEYQNLIHSLFKSLTLMDERYFEEKKTTLDSSRAVTLFVNKRDEIIDLYLKGDFKAVIKRSLELKEIFGPDALTTEIGLLFALSLAKEGKLEQAIEIGEGIASELDQLPDIIQLRSKIAQWQLKLGRNEKAVHTYEKLTDNQDERMALIQNLNGQISRAMKYEKSDISGSPEPKSAPDANVRQGEYSIDQLLEEVSSLVRKHAYSEARILLLRERLKIEEGSESEIIDRELARIEQREEEFQEQKRIRDAYLKQTFDAAKRLIEEEKFEEAVNKLDEIKNAQDLTAESAALRERAVENHINQERNRAAEIFLAAKKTKDLAKREELLKSSYEILKALIDKYPASPLNQKLKSHLTIVEKEIDRLQ
ncbi:MAG: hypothetical protein MUO68_00640 [Desulfobacteraceae bacterium]|nr:hypothetical protein [Desulfobacteraceae bacterium]